MNKLMIVVALWLVVIVGWVGNIVQLVTSINDPITGLFIFKCVGALVFPIGAVLGWVGFF